MARFAVMADTVIDGLKYPKGSVLNIPSSNKDVKTLNALGDPATGQGASTATLYAMPRARTNGGIVAGTWDVSTVPPYNPVAPADQLGRQQSTGQLPPNTAGPNLANVIVEPVLPAPNKQYD